jgi:aldehyde:ferredoxin oxidoreductase
MGSYDGKAAMVIDIQNTVNALFTLISCRFHEFVTEHGVYPQFVKAAMGRDMTWTDMFRLGERIWNLEKIFNLRAGLSRADDRLPGRCFEPVLGDSSEGAVVEENKFEAMLDEYYALRGWDREGIPGEKKLEELGIGEYRIK